MSNPYYNPSTNQLTPNAVADNAFQLSDVQYSALSQAQKDLLNSNSAVSYVLPDYNAPQTGSTLVTPESMATDQTKAAADQLLYKQQAAAADAALKADPNGPYAASPGTVTPYYNKDPNKTVAPVAPAPAPVSNAPASPSAPQTVVPNNSQTTPAPAPALVLSGGNLQRGTVSADVSQLQKLLGITADGNFGSQTLAAVKAFQASHGLTPDGIVGPKTLAALNESKTGPSPVNNVSSGVSSNVENKAPTTPSTGNAQIDGLIAILNKQSPQKSFSDVYKEIFTSLGLDTMKSDYAAQTKAFSDLQNEKNEKIQEINNNPWYTEGVRVGKLRALDSKYEGKENILTNKLKLLETNMSNGRADAQFIAGQTMDQLQQSSKLTQDVILKAIDIAEKQAEAERSSPTSVKEYEYAVKQGYKGTFSQYQNEDANRKAKVAGGGLTPGQVNTTINSIASSFDNEQIVKNYNTTQEGYQTIKSIGTKTNSPADDIAFIYSFAKIMDPNSVVREGEYNTIQKYAQTWADNFGFSAKRIFSNTNFLTADAKQKMLNTLEPKINTIAGQYKNLQSEYQRQIDDAYAGRPRQITNYSGGVSASSSSSNPKFDSLAPLITIDGSSAYLPRTEWDKVAGTQKDELLKYVKSLGYNLLIN